LRVEVFIADGWQRQICWGKAERCAQVCLH
jgi:hypothetical protein